MPLPVACSSVSSMWTTNAAMVSPSADTADDHVCFTAANLNCKLHRFIEHSTTNCVSAVMSNDERHLVHHAVLPTVSQFGNEGVANYTRSCRNYGDVGAELLVFGHSASGSRFPTSQRYPARQTLKVCQAVARLYRLNGAEVTHTQQNSVVTDQGVFRNDMISVGSGEALFHHEGAFLDTEKALAEPHDKLGRHGGHFRAVRVSRDQVVMEDAMESYLLSSQLLSEADGSMLLVVPEERRNSPRVWSYLDQFAGDGGPICEVKVFDLKQSMQNDGGPVCLRLRVALQERELTAVNPGMITSAGLYDTLVAWIDRHYCDRSSETDLVNPQLLLECWTALDKLTQTPKLGSVYSFQPD